jgi:hypothetical protein
MTSRLGLLAALMLLLAACAGGPGDPVQGQVNMRGSYTGGVVWNSR